MSLSLRPFDQEYSTLLALADAAVPFDPVGNRLWLAHRRRFDDARRVRRHYLVDEAGAEQAVAYGTAEQDVADPRRFRLFVLTEPTRLSAGVGDLLMERLLADLRELEAETAWVREYGRDADLLGFFRGHGFRETQRVWDLRLPVAEAEASGLLPDVESVQITTLAAERQRVEDALPRLHQAVNALFAPIPFEQFAAWLDRPGLSPEAYFVARDGEAYVGVSVWAEEPDRPELLSQQFTAVRPAYRPLGLANALREAAAAYAAQAGYEALVTHVLARETETLAAHEELGFRRQFEYVTLEKTLSATS